MNTCPYIESAFQILARKWNGQIIHYLSLCKDYRAHFSELKTDFTGITSRSLSLKLSELVAFELIDKNVTSGSPVTISYELTEKGKALANALKPIQEWAMEYQNVAVSAKEEN
ncbi:transcriptional regulator [Virgibacillus profundi]|uniref:Transcriptional regulator n=1 Tax=Virgibacillus profundi TaxID=2024555 RepID=A0A2A2IGE7_9BACI|nr:helix-turn-helix domain-containing protein [Virgibacillus profundi]PAV30727.1 transcriptional regulator [Virgibacillus profundi]PXY54899.1 transcriptional regulator [Virgibacillus profundi]